MSAMALYDLALALDCSIADLYVGLPILSPAPAQDGQAPNSAAQDARLWGELRDAALRLSPRRRQALIAFVKTLPSHDD